MSPFGYGTVIGTTRACPAPSSGSPGTTPPDLDWSRGNPFNFHEEYKAGYDRGFEDGLQKGGKAAGKGKAEDGLQKGG